MRLISVYKVDDYKRAVRVLYQVLSERPLDHGISHKRMPSFAAHQRFVASRPFRHWLMIDDDGVYRGYIEVLPTNEFGVHILKRYQGRGYGTRAVHLFMAIYKPLPAIPARRNGHWLANVAPANHVARKFFQDLGFKRIQETYVYES